MAVFHGTQAERDGIRRGQIVKSVNGKTIRTRRDVATFANAPELIMNVEVEDGK